MPSLRGHHLICLHFFDGSGYSPEFIANLKTVLNDADKRRVEVLYGADDICGKCPYLAGNTCTHTENADEEIRRMDNTAMELLQVSEGSILKWNEIKALLEQVFPEWHKRFCIDCEWISTCKKSPLFEQHT